MWYSDARKGTKAVDAVLEKYIKALQDEGMIGHDGLFVNTYRVKQGCTVPASDVAFTAWF
jgi:hypothetical protein